MLDFNAPPGGPRGPDRPFYDQDALSAALAACAEHCMPAIFTSGKIDKRKGELRCADISGAPPRNQGSCVIQLRGDKAGSYYDHGIEKGGGPLATIGDHFGLSDDELFAKAAQIAEQYGGHVNGNVVVLPIDHSASAARKLAEAQLELGRADPILLGTLAEVYFKSRNLALPAAQDLMFSSEATYRANGAQPTAEPAVIARVRFPNGEPTGGIHRTFLKRDGSGHLERMCLGPCEGGVIMLGDPTADGELGIAEGIETAAAVTQLTGLPCWSGISTGHMRRFGNIIRQEGLSGVNKLYIFADRGRDGEATAEMLRVCARAGGMQAQVVLPQSNSKGNDDFLNDLQQGLPAPDLTVEQPPTAETLIEWSTSPRKAIERFNARYAVVNEAGKAMVYERVKDSILGRYVLTRITFADFKKLYQNRFVDIPSEKGMHRKPAAEYWLSHEDRRQFISGVVFDPTGNMPDDCWNLWSGFAAEPQPGDWSLMRDHIRQVICAGDDSHFEYLLSWTALMFQCPEKQGEVAVVVRGGKGVGKGIFFNYLRKAWGQHGIYISNAKHLVGNFNAHLRDCVMLFADEAFFANDRQHESVLKGAVTDPVLAIEGKNQNVVNAPNMLHIGMASNADWVVPASHDERRYFMLNASDHRCGQRAYFAAIVAQMDNGGLAAMIHEMLHRDISSFDVRDVPQTDALSEQKKHSLDSLDRWWLAVLDRGFVWRSRFGATVFDNWNDVVSTELLNRSYLQWCGDNRVNYPMSRVQLGKRMTELYQSHRDKAGVWGIIGEVESLARFADPVVKKERPPGYEVQSLDDARARFLEMRKISKEWGDA